VEPSQAGELSDKEVDVLAADATLYSDYNQASSQVEYLDPHKFYRAIIAAINAKGDV
jgi:hypothetical protein